MQERALDESPKVRLQESPRSVKSGEANTKKDQTTQNNDDKKDNQSDSQEEVEELQPKSSFTRIIKLFFFVLIIGAGTYLFVQYINQKPEITEPYYEDDVLVLKSNYFWKVLASNNLLLVEFYAPWCGHCKKLAPEYSKAARVLKESNSSIVLAKIDATEEQDLATQYGVQGFPTLKYFVNQVAIDYKGGRTAEDIIAWCIKKSGPPSIHVKSVDSLKEMIENNQVTIVYFGKEDQDFELFQKIANDVDGADFAHTFNSNDKSAFQVEDNVKLVIFKKFDEKRNDYSGDFELEAIKEFISVYSNPILMEFNSKAIELIFQEKNSAAVLFTNDDHQEFTNTFEKIAKEYRRNMRFTFIKPNDEMNLFARLAEYLGASQTELPNIMLIRPEENNEKFKFEGELNEDNLRVFIRNFIEGRLQKFLKSQEIPEVNDEPVKVLVGKSFDQFVFHGTEDVLVEFYAPWCQHCKKLAPIYEQVAIKLQDNKNIIIAKMDSTENEIKYVDITSFPQIYLWRNGHKDEPVLYEGERSEEGILEFLKQQTTHSWAGEPDKEQEKQEKQEEKEKQSTDL